MSEAHDLGGQLRDYIDEIAPALSLDEVTRANLPIVPDLAPSEERPRPRAWVAVAALVAVAAAIGGLLIGLRPSDPAGRVESGPAASADPPTVPTPSPTSSPAGPQPDFEVLGMRATTEPMMALQSALDDQAYAALWQLLGLRSDDRPDVDFTRWIVVGITIADDACPPTLDGFDRDGSTWTPRFVEPTSECIEPLIPKTFVVAINRDEVTPSFTLRLPDALTVSSGESSMQVAVPRLIAETAPVTGTTQAPRVRAVAEAALTQPWGCGDTYAMTNGDHSVALVLRRSAQLPATGSTVQLPSAAWVAEVQLGHDLLTVPCQDRDFAANPAPDETWPVLSGTVEVSTPPAGGCGTAEPATALVKQATVRAPDGTTITFPDLTISHHDWGCAAG